MNRLQRVLLSLFGAGLLACSSDSRNEPSPAEMCENLSTECAGFKAEELNACQELGQDGLRDETRQDACYVYYDTCIDRCRFYREFGEYLPDAGADAGALDAAAPPVTEAGSSPLQSASDAGIADAGVTTDGNAASVPDSGQ